MPSSLLDLPRMQEASAESVEEVEISLLLDGVFRIYGYDFRQYAPKTVRRRVMELMKSEKVVNVSALQERVFHNPDVRNRLVSSLSVQVSEFFRDPAFFRTFREKAVPILRTYPLIRIWHAGCATGEEVYSMAILLKESDLLEKSLLYATDINAHALQLALKGEYSAAHVEACAKNYKQAGGTRGLLHYFKEASGILRVDHTLRDHIVFTRHNLVGDSSFNEFNVILCRNVLIYFTKELRDQVHALLHGSLARLGILALGAKETIRFTAYEKQYRPLAETQNLYRRVN